MALPKKKPTRIESAKVDPKDQRAIDNAIRGKELAPSFAEQSGTFVDWKKIRDELGQPFNFETIPLRKLKQMSKDPMLRFGLHYITTPHIRAPYHIEARDKNGINAQVAGFMGEAWKIIHANYIMQSLLSLRWGHQPIVKRFQMANPGGVYRDETEADPAKQLKPVWDEGNVLPVIWKPFVALDPARCEPIFDDTTGEFAGINYEVPSSDKKKKSGSGSGSATKAFREIDVFRSLWITHDRDSQFGSIYGYPRIGHAYRYWWSYWYSWAMIDRAIERMAVPPLLAYHPVGDWEDPDNPDETQPYHEIALDAAERLRSNAIAAVPSTLATAGLEDKGTQQREWDFKFLETENLPIEQMLLFAQYCDVMKLRSLWVPEQAFIEGQGGSSSRNVTERMSEAHIESQANLWETNIDHVNRYVFPQLLARNHPEFVNNGGTCRIVGHGFAKDDIELLKQLIQLVGQSDPNKLGVDIRAGLERLNVPLLTPEKQAQELADAALAAQTAQPPVVPGVTARASGAGIFAPGSTNGGSVPEPAAPGASVLGFDDMVVYIQPGESIELSDSEEFLSSLPTSAHYSDKTMRALSLQLRRLWKGHMRELYPDLARFVNAQQIELEDQPSRRTVTMAAAKKAATKLLKDWSVGSKRLEQLGKQSRILLEKMMQRANKITSKQSNLKTSFDPEIYDEWLTRQVGRLIKSTHETVRDEVRNFLINEIRDGNDAKQIAENLREHFTSMSVSKADMIARSEARDAYNAATLMTGEQAELKYVRAHDGTEFDETCRDRNGKLMTINQAWRETNPSRTHPRCQLGFELIARAEFSVKTVANFPEGGPDPEETFAFFEDSTSTAYILREADIEASERWLGLLMDVLVKEGYRETAATNGSAT